MCPLTELAHLQGAPGNPPPSVNTSTALGPGWGPCCPPGSENMLSPANPN